MLLFNAAGFLISIRSCACRACCRFNPAGMSAVAPDLTFNTAVSFTTNTNWQNYGGESTISLPRPRWRASRTQNFVSAATGIALAVALIRGFARASAKTVGNFWVDLTRCTLYILLPLSIIAAMFLVWQGMPQTLGAYVDATTLEGAKQTSPADRPPRRSPSSSSAPMAAASSTRTAAHPFENPTPLTTSRDRSTILLISARAHHTFGRMVENQRQGWAILAVMCDPVPRGCRRLLLGRRLRQPEFCALGLDPANMEGKEVRFGMPIRASCAVTTTDASNGSVNAMHDTSRHSAVWCRCSISSSARSSVGGVGAGLYGMLLFVIIAVFVAGLMVGRTPEYLGKKIEAKEVKMAMLAILILPLMYARLHGGRHGAALRLSPHRQCRARMASREILVSLHLEHRQQRLGLRRHHRQHASRTT